MDFRLVTRSAALNDLEQRNGQFCVILPNSVAFVSNYVKVVDYPSADFLPRNVKVHQQSTTDALCSSR